MTSVEIKPKGRIGLDEILSGISQLDVKELENFFTRVGSILAKRKAKHLTEREFELLSIINHGLPHEHRENYKGLLSKRQTGNLTEGEYQYLLKMQEEVEEGGVKRLQALVKLSALRNVPIKDLMAELGIAAPLAYG